MNQISENKSLSSQYFMQVAGPLLLICSAALLGRVPPVFNFDLLAVLILGLYFSARWKIKGFIYSLSLLFLSVCFKHIFIDSHHAWQLGLETSVSIGLIVSALCFKENGQFVDFLQTQHEKKEQTIQFLEEDLAKFREKSILEHSEMGEKIGSLQSTLEEIQIELSSVQVLNDVLRKTTAKALEEKDEFEKRICHFEHLVDVTREENQKLQETIQHLSQENEIIFQNEQLLSELNALRIKEVQTAKINEQLVHLHAIESQKVKNLEEKCFALNSENEITSSQFVQLSQEMHSLQETQKNHQKSESEKLFLQTRLQDVLSELEFAKNEHRQLQKSYNDLSVERANTSKENIEALESKIANLFDEKEKMHRELSSNLETTLLEKTQLQQEIETVLSEKEKLSQELLQKIETVQLKESINSKEFNELISQKNHLLEQLQFFRASLEESANIEALYRQLKSQFEEKNQILHETRSQLFHVDTELQTIRQELEQKDLEHDPLSFELREELHHIEEEIQFLQEENLQLYDLVTHLMNTNEIDPLKIVKKKMKKISFDFPEQGRLF